MAFADELGSATFIDDGEQIQLLQKKVMFLKQAILNDVDSSGWYVQAVYKFNPKMRAGIRYSKLGSPDLSVLDEDDEID